MNKARANIGFVLKSVLTVSVRATAASAQSDIVITKQPPGKARAAHAKYDVKVKVLNDSELNRTSVASHRRRKSALEAVALHGRQSVVLRDQYSF